MDGVDLVDCSGQDHGARTELSAYICGLSRCRLGRRWIRFLFAFIRVHSRLLLLRIDDGATHVAGFQSFVHEVIEMGGVFPGFSAAFFDEVRT